ncbi:unnamed protein product, partial [Boreogadus saida]
LRHWEHCFVSKQECQGVQPMRVERCSGESDLLHLTLLTNRSPSDGVGRRGLGGRVLLTPFGQTWVERAVVRRTHRQA